MSAFLRFQRTSQSTKPSIANTSRLAPRRVGLLWKGSPSVASQNLQLIISKKWFFEKIPSSPRSEIFLEKQKFENQKKKMAGSHQPSGSEPLGSPWPGFDSSGPWLVSRNTSASTCPAKDAIRWEFSQGESFPTMTVASCGWCGGKCFNHQLSVNFSWQTIGGWTKSLGNGWKSPFPSILNWLNKGVPGGRIPPKERPSRTLRMTFNSSKNDLDVFFFKFHWSNTTFQVKTHPWHQWNHGFLLTAASKSGLISWIT